MFRSRRAAAACFTSPVLGSMKCDCKQQLEMAMVHQGERTGNRVLFATGGRGIGLANKIAAYAVQEEGLDTGGRQPEIGVAGRLARVHRGGEYASRARRSKRAIDDE